MCFLESLASKPKANHYLFLYRNILLQSWKLKSLTLKMKAWTLQVCCANIAVPCRVSDCCNMHSFNTTTELIKLRNVYYLSEFSPSHPCLRDQEIQTKLFLYSKIHAHTMDMYLLSLYSTVGIYSTVGHTCYLFLACSSHFSPFFSLFLSPSLCLFHIDNISLAAESTKQYRFSLHSVLTSACESHHI